MDIPSDPAKKNSIGHLKEFYLQRLAKAEPAAAARLGAGTQGSLNSGELGQAPPLTNQVCRPTFTADAAEQGGEDLEIMCNNCFTLIRSSEAAEHGNTCFINLNRPEAGNPAKSVAVLDMKLAKLRSALEARLQDAGSKVNVMRHLTQLRYHIDTATKWVPGCSEIGALSDHTVQQVKQLTATSRVLAPAVYIFSKRIENVIVQKERELRKGVSGSLAKASGDGLMDTLDVTAGAMSLADASSIVSEMDSDCGTQYPETVVTQDRKTDSADVGNVQDANDYLSLKNEDEQRRWFYSQCLTVKLSCPNQARARRTLISDLYSKVKAEGVPIEGWVEWIRGQLSAEDGPGGSGGAPVASMHQEVGAAAGDKAAGGPVAMLGLSALTTAAGTPTPSGAGTKLPTMFHASGAVTARSAVGSAASVPTGGSVLSARSVNDPLGPTRPVLAVGSGGRPAAPQGGGAAGAGGAAAAGTAPGASPSVVLRPGQAMAGQTQPAGGYTTYVRPQGMQGLPAQYAQMTQAGGLKSQSGTPRS